MVYQRPPEDRKSASPRSNTESRPLSRNAQAQARLRARRRAHVESLEAEIKRLQSIVDATALHPGRNSRVSTSTSSPLEVYSSPVQPSSSNSDFGTNSHPLDTVQQLRSDNERLRRERDAFRVQVEALMGYVSRGCTLPSALPPLGAASNSLTNRECPGLESRENEQSHSPTPGSEIDSEDRHSQSNDPFSQSPLIQANAYTRDETHQLLSLYGSNLAFLRQLDLHAQGSLLYSSEDKPIQLPALLGSNPFGGAV